MKSTKNMLYKAKEFNNIKEIIEDAVTKYPSNNAFIIKKKEGKQTTYDNITYTRFSEEINALGTALIHNGLKGKRIAVISKNRYEWVLGYLATINGTGIVVPLDKGLTKQAIESSLIRSKCDAIIFSSEYLEIIKEIAEAKSTNVSKLICMDDRREEKIVSINDLIKEGKALIEKGNREFIDAKINNEEMSIILFTSGTTSQSKAVMLSHKNIASNIYALTMAEKIYDTDVNLAFLPFHHTFGSTGILFFLSARSNQYIL